MKIEEMSAQRLVSELVASAENLVPVGEDISPFWQAPQRYVEKYDRLYARVLSLVRLGQAYEQMRGKDDPTTE